MTLQIGDKIRTLRKSQDVTQEKLADYLNISYQAVSKWENGTALPDITFVPKIANFFGITADELLGMKDAEETEELKSYEKVYRENNKHGKMFDNIMLSRKVLEKYPRNYQWMLNLAYPLTEYTDTEEHHRYSIEHNFRDEAIKLCERILEDCTVDSIRHSAIQILCYQYPAAGKKELALKLANEMPNMYVCKEQLLAHIYEGEEKVKQWQYNLIHKVDLCATTIEMLTSNNLMGKELTLYQKINFLEAAYSFYRLIFGEDENSLFYNCRLCKIYSRLASLWCGADEHNKAMEYLLLAEKTANAYDKCVNLGAQPYKSLLVNRCTFDPKSVGKNWIGTQKQALLEEISNKVFDKLRERKDFADLQKRLSE